MTYPVPRIARHAAETGLSFHEALADLERIHGPAPTYPCAHCGEPIVDTADALCGSCLFDEDV
jgi:hypothetical protein